MTLRSLRWRLGLAYAAIIVVALTVTLGAVNVLVERALIENTAARLEIEAGLIVPTNPGRGNAPITSLAAPEVARILGGQQTAVVILDGAGSALATETNGAGPAVVGARLDPASYQAVVASGQAVDRVVAASDGGGHRVLIVAAPIRFTGAVAGLPTDDLGATASPGGQGQDKDKVKGNGNGNNGNGNNGNGRGLGAGAGGTETGSSGPPNAVAQLAVSLDDVDATLGSLRTALLAVGGAALLLALFVVVVVTAKGLSPLTRVALVADRVAAGDLTARAGLPSGDDEIGRLGRAFDRMVGRLEGSFGAQRQFAADASHELRTPLTVLGGYVDVLSNGGHDTPETKHRILAAMRREIDRLSRLAADLLLLTQLEAGGGRLTPERVDVGELLTDLGEAARVIGPDRHVEVRAEGSLPALADRDRLTQALLNLVDNAVRHAPVGSVVGLSARRDDPWVVAEIRNDGLPIPEAHLARVFERFYRADRSVEPGRHAGLGLAIVKAIIEASAGTVAATSDSSGTRFTVRLPLDPVVVAPRSISGATGLLRDVPTP
jgi:two-component system OmpR family sensor kinase